MSPSFPVQSQGSGSSTIQNASPISLLAGFALIYSWLIGNITALGQLHSQLMNGAHALLATEPSPIWNQTNVLHSASLCLFKHLMHLPCLFCGLTRSFILIGQGHWAESLRYHPLGLPLYGLAIALTCLGVLKPDWAKHTTGLLSTRKSLTVALLLFSVCWLWKLGQNPRFW